MALTNLVDQGQSSEWPDARLRTLEFGIGAPELTVLVPTFHDDVAPLVEALTACAGAHRIQLIIYDDGSQDTVLESRMIHALMTFPGTARVLLAEENVGRSEARNRLLAQASTDWVVLLDADMLPDDHLFLARYFDAIRLSDAPTLVSGGFSLKRVDIKPGRSLHALQSAASECMPADVRNQAPGRYVFTSNLLVHRTILEAVPFDTGFQGWGWEDVAWGLSVETAFPISHIDNTATHLGLDTDQALITKYARSSQNFARLAERHSSAVEAMPLFIAARRAQWLGPLRRPAASLFGAVARATLLPSQVRLFALKLVRALHYSKVLPE